MVKLDTDGAHVLCDNPDCQCGHFVPCAGTSRRARQAARKVGWVRKRLWRWPGNWMGQPEGGLLVDLCSRCAKEEFAGAGGRP